MKRFLALLLCLCLYPSFSMAGLVQLQSDDWSAASNNADIGANWTPNKNNFQILSNRITHGASDVDSAERYSGRSWPADQYSRTVLNVVSTGSAGTGFGAGARMDTSGTVQTYYGLITGSAGYELQKFVSGAFTSLSGGAKTTTTFAIGDVVELQAIGSNPVTFIMRKALAASPTVFTEFFVSGSTRTTDASSPITSGAVGVVYSSSTATDKGITSWTGGAVVTNSTSPILFP